MKVDKSTRRAQLERVLYGVKKRLSGVSTVMLSGRVVTTAELERKVQAELDAMARVTQAKAAFHAAVAAEERARKEVEPDLRDFKRFVGVQFGDTVASVTALNDFGYEPRKVGVRTPAAKALAAERALATRAARHTLGPKQKAKIHGVVLPPAPPAPPGSHAVPTAMAASVAASSSPPLSPVNVPVPVPGNAPNNTAATPTGPGRGSRGT